MTSSAKPSRPAGRRAAAADTPAGAGAAAPDDARQLRQQIGRTREDLGETVAELAARADVKARARDKATGLAGRVKGQASRAGKDLAAGADSWRKQLAGTTAGHAGRHRVPLAAGAAALIAAWVIIWRLRGR